LTFNIKFLWKSLTFSLLGSKHAAVELEMEIGVLFGMELEVLVNVNGTAKLLTNYMTN
jgi:hypothetical protein